MCFIEDGREPLVCSVKRAQHHARPRLPVLIPFQQIDLDRLSPRAVWRLFRRLRHPPHPGRGWRRKNEVLW